MGIRLGITLGYAFTEDAYTFVQSAADKLSNGDIYELRELVEKYFCQFFGVSDDRKSIASIDDFKQNPDVVEFLNHKALSCCDEYSLRLSSFLQKNESTGLFSTSVLFQTDRGESIHTKPISKLVDSRFNRSVEFNEFFVLYSSESNHRYGDDLDTYLAGNSVENNELILLGSGIYPYGGYIDRETRKECYWGDVASDCMKLLKQKGKSLDYAEKHKIVSELVGFSPKYRPALSMDVYLFLFAVYKLCGDSLEAYPLHLENFVYPCISKIWS